MTPPYFFENFSGAKRRKIFTGKILNMKNFPDDPSFFKNRWQGGGHLEWIGLISFLVVKYSVFFFYSFLVVKYSVWSAGLIPPPTLLFKIQFLICGRNRPILWPEGPLSPRVFPKFFLSQTDKNSWKNFKKATPPSKYRFFAGGGGQMFLVYFLEFLSVCDKKKFRKTLGLSGPSGNKIGRLSADFSKK